MTEDKNKKKVVTDEDVSKLLEELLGAGPGESAAAPESTKDSSRSALFSEDRAAMNPLLADRAQTGADGAGASAPQQPVVSPPEEESDSDDFLIEDEGYDPKLEATYQKAEKVRARAEAMATGAAVALERTRKAVEPMAGMLGHDVETRKRNLQTIWGYIGFLAALLTGLVFLIYIYIAISLSGEHQYKEQLSAAIKKMTGHELAIEGAVDFELFPRPRFVIGTTQLKNTEGTLKPYMLTVKSIELKPSLLWLVLNTVKVREAVLHDPVINLENFIGQAPNWQWYDKESVWYDGSGKPKSQPATASASAENLLQQLEEYLGGADIVLLNARVLYSSGVKENPTERVMQFENARVRASSLHGPFYTSGALTLSAASAPLGYELEIADLQKSDKPEVSFSVQMSDSIIAMEGAMLSDNKGSWSIQGKLKSSVSKSAGIKGIELPKIFSGMLSEGNSMLQGDFFASPEKVELQNVVVNSDQAKGTMNVGLIYGAPNVVSLALEAETLDLDSLLSAEKSMLSEKKTARMHNTLSETLLGLDLPRDMTVRLNTDIKALTYKKQTIKDIRTDIQVGSNSMILRAVDINGLPGNTVIKAASKPDDQGQFVGRFSVHSDDFHQFLTWVGREPVLTQDQLKNFRFDSAVIMSEQAISLEELDMMLGGSHVTGKIALRPGKGVVADADIAIDTFDLKPELQAAAEGPTETARTEQDIFTPLRRVEVWFEKLNLALAVKNVGYGEGQLDNLSAKAMFSEGVSTFEDVSFDSKFGKVQFSGKVSHQLLIPAMDISLSLEKADVNDIGEMFGYDLSKKTRTRWSEQLLRIDKLANYAGHVELKIGSLTYHDFKADDISTGLELADEKMTLKGFRAKMFDSRLKLEGYVITNDQPMGSFTFSLANSDVHDLMHSLFGFDAVEGKANVTGGITLSGLSPYQWVATLQGNLHFVSRGIRVKGFNFTTLIQRLPILQSIKEVQYWVPRALYTGETDFVFASGGGKITQGVLTIPELVLRNGYLKKIDTAASLNLPEWTVKLKSNVLIGREKYAYPTTLTLESSIDQPAGRWDQKMIEVEWEKLFYAGTFRGQ